MVSSPLPGEPAVHGEADSTISSAPEPLFADDVSGRTWELSTIADGRVSDSLYVYRNTYHLLPWSVAGGGIIRNLKFFGNEVEVVAPEAEGIELVEHLEVRVPTPRFSPGAIARMKGLKELKISLVPPRPSALTVLSEITTLKCLSKLAISHYSLRYLPPELRSLKKLEELDLSFNKLKTLPSFISELSSLKLLRVSNNKLVDLPSEISSLQCLEVLDLSSNRLTSLSLKLSSMRALQYLNLQSNRIVYSCAVPPWICCDMRGNHDDFGKSERLEEIDAGGAKIVAGSVRLLKRCNGCNEGSSCSELSSNLKFHSTQRMKKGWKRRDCLQERARQERLNLSRSKNSGCSGEEIAVNMCEEDNLSSVVMERKLSGMSCTLEEASLENSCISSDDMQCMADDELHGVIEDSRQQCSSNLSSAKKFEGGYEEESSCTSSQSICLNKDCHIENDLDDSASSISSINKVNAIDGHSAESSRILLNAKRHHDMDNNPKPTKFRKPVGGCSNISLKYSRDSFCSVEDHLPDGFYDAGRDRPFMSMQDYEQSLGMYSREVILLDRESDEELDAIAFSAQLLLCNLQAPTGRECEVDATNDLLRASVLALFVSDCFGGCDRNASLMRTRRAVVSLKKQQPFVCTCSGGGMLFDCIGTLRQSSGSDGHYNFTELCDKSLQIIKERRNSSVVPIGALQFGVCRHRAVLMKYLCDRADPPIPCELVRGYLDYMPHAWNIIPVRRGDKWVRMIVDACYPSNIKEETDPEYFCRYIPQTRISLPLENESSSFDCSFPSVLNHAEIERTPSSCVYHCKVGPCDASAKVRYLDAQVSSNEEIREFEYKFLGEVRMLGALRNHRCIVNIYGHQLSSRWVPSQDGNQERRLLQSVLIMEYVKGGSLKVFLENLRKNGEAHISVDLAFHIAKEVACALVELHSKLIIHRDIKSENVLIDFDARDDGLPAVKLCDFDRSVPLHSTSHSCCIAHLGIHPPDVCVGTPRWMAPEVLQAMHGKNQYGLEVDIWSYGCLLVELLTLDIPYHGMAETEILGRVTSKQGPPLTSDLQDFIFDDPRSRQKLGIESETEAEKLKLLINLFRRCVTGSPTDRPTAEHIYSTLCSSFTETDDS